MYKMPGYKADGIMTGNSMISIGRTDLMKQADSDLGKGEKTLI